MRYLSGFSLHERSRSQVLPVELEQIKRKRGRFLIMLTTVHEFEIHWAPTRGFATWVGIQGSMNPTGRRFGAGVRQSVSRT